MAKLFRSRFEVVAVGPPQFQRYVIRDSQIADDRAYYAGKEARPWSPDLREARRYKDHADAREEIEAIARRERSRLPTKRYRFEVEVTALGEATMAQVRKFLDEALTLRLDRREHGDGPTAGTLVT